MKGAEEQGDHSKAVAHGPEATRAFICPTLSVHGVARLSFRGSVASFASGQTIFVPASVERGNVSFTQPAFMC